MKLVSQLDIIHIIILIIRELVIFISTNQREVQISLPNLNVSMSNNAKIVMMYVNI